MNSIHDPNSPTSTSMLAAGMLLDGRYLIERELGRGGIGVVYLARDTKLLSKSVVVKVLLEESLQNEWVVKKFQQEMEALTRIEHPGVIGILDAGQTPQGAPYIVMQYVEGSSLRAAMRAGEGMELERVADIMRQTGEALSAAHEEGVLHRDLKPENIMLRRGRDGREQVKLIDFGIAKIRNSLVAPSTVTALTVGTVAYMSPEQLEAQPLSPASDLYALGVIAYEMTTGRRPFTPDSVFQLLQMQKEGVRVKPRDLRPSLPESAQGVILRALSYAAKDRWHDAREFGDALWRALNEDAEDGNNRPSVDPSMLPTVTAKPPEADRRPDGRPAAMELGHVLFTDIVGYSKLPIDAQTRVLGELQQVVRSTPEFIRAQGADQLIRLPTGDGMALVFFGDPEAPVRCALEISQELKNHPDIELRMGIHSGPVDKVKDVNDKMNVAGAGINMAQRVMDCGDAGHILLSKRVAEDLAQYSRWPGYLHDLGEAEVKHGVRVHVFNLYTGEVGNPDPPAKFKTHGKRERKETLRSRAALVAAITVVAVITAAALFWIFRPGRVVGGNTGDGMVANTANAPERRLSYWVEVQKYRDGKPDKEPFRVAGEMIFQVGDHVWFDFTSPQAGYLYVINEGPEPQHDLPQYNILFPTPTSNNNSSAVTANQTLRIPGERGFKIDEERGTEKIWVVWSAQRINDLERIAKEVVTRERHGVVSDPDEIKIIQDLLKAHSSVLPKVAKNEEKKLTTIQSSGDVMVTVQRLEHY